MSAQDHPRERDAETASRPSSPPQDSVFDTDDPARVRIAFLQAAAHDLRNPLSLVASSLDLLNNLIETDDPTTQEVLTVAQNGITQALQLVSDILDMQKIEHGVYFNREREEVDLRELLHEIARECRLMMEQNAIAFSLDIAPDLPQYGTFAPDWVKRALLNLLDNALKYTHSQVRLRVDATPDALLFDVEDDGNGISDEAQARLFDRFYRAEGGAKSPGTGLGLAIVRLVAEAHGGTVSVQSEAEQRGAIFKLRLPRQLDTDSPDEGSS